jgi:hypothetical protein
MRPNRDGKSGGARYNREVRLRFTLLLILSLAACNRGNQNKDAVRQAVVNYLSAKGFSMSTMNVELTAVQFNGQQADATVAFAPKGTSAAQGMSMVYHLEQQDGKWTVLGRKEAGGAPHGAAGAMTPPAQPVQGDNPHGATPPAPAGKMPSPEDLPPAAPKK